MKLRKIALAAAALAISIAPLAAASYSIELEGKGTKTINAIERNSLEYVSLAEIAEKILPGSKLDRQNRKIEFERRVFRYAPGSFFILCETDGVKRVAQMKAPAIRYESEVYFPLGYFLEVLPTLGLYKIEAAEDKLRLVRLGEAEMKEAQAESEKQKTKSDSPQIEKSREMLFSSPDVTYSRGYNPEEETEEKNRGDKKSKKANNSQDKLFKYFNKKEYPPNKYVLPEDLQRGSVNGGEREELYASASSEAIPEENLANITKIYSECVGDELKIHLYADSIIEEYHKPECEGGDLTIRIPNAIDGIDDYSMAAKAPVVSISPEKIRQFQLYRVKVNGEIRDCKSRRNGPKELIYTAYLSENYGAYESESAASPTDIEKDKKKWALDVIVLDPGHGGKDCGAVGVTGIYEKDMTLKIARQVKGLLSEDLSGTKVVMTRETDKFVELYKRGEIANKAGGKLFISIHLNAARSKPSSANGCETYILRPGKNEDAVRVANLENSVIKFEEDKSKYKDLTEEQLIIATMAQSAFAKFSERFARELQEEVCEETKLRDRGVKQAGFYVLIGASMPNVLFEGGFLSNESDERYVSSEWGQKEIARGIVKAVKRYAREYGR